jgi:hypothetical protein
MRNVRFTEFSLKNQFAFYPYTIKEGDRIDTIAYHYYDDDKYAWIVMLSNNIVDPYYDWPLDNENFLAAVTKKYGSLSVAQSTIKEYRPKQTKDTLSTSAFDALSNSLKKYWVPSVSFKGEIIEYTRKPLDLKITSASFDELTEAEQNYWYSVSVFDYEEELNHNKRFIKLLDPKHIPVVESYMNRLLK